LRVANKNLDQIMAELQLEEEKQDKTKQKKQAKRRRTKLKKIAKKQGITV